MKNLPCGITLYDGALASDLHDGVEPESPLQGAMHGIESMILAHHLAGVNVSEEAYLEGIETAVEACARQLPDDEEIPGLVPMIDASTAHLSAYDTGLLDRMSDSRIVELPRTMKHQYGWLLYLPSSSDQDTVGMLESAISDHSMGQGLADLIRYGMRHGAFILNLDCDADPIPGIQTIEDGEAAA